MINKKLVLIVSVALLALSFSFAASINAPDAERIALDHAGLLVDDVGKIQIKSDKKAGYDVYKVEFRTAEGKYEYEVLAADGRIISYEFDMDDDKIAPSPSSVAVDRNSAFRAALQAAGVDEKDVVSKKVEYEREVFGSHYDVEFSDGTYKWDFKIGEDGSVLEGEYELKRKGLPASGTSLLDQSMVQSMVERLLGGPLGDISIRTDYDDGRRIFKVHAVKDGFIYQAELNAFDGTVYSLEWKKQFGLR